MSEDTWEDALSDFNSQDNEVTENLESAKQDFWEIPEKPFAVMKDESVREFDIDPNISHIAETEVKNIKLEAYKTAADQLEVLGMPGLAETIFRKGNAIVSDTPEPPVNLTEGQKWGEGLKSGISSTPQRLAMSASGIEQVAKETSFGMTPEQQKFYADAQAMGLNKDQLDSLKETFLGDKHKKLQKDRAKAKQVSDILIKEIQDKAPDERAGEIGKAASAVTSAVIDMVPTVALTSTGMSAPLAVAPLVTQSFGSHYDNLVNQEGIDPGKALQMAGLFASAEGVMTMFGSAGKLEAKPMVDALKRIGGEAVEEWSTEYFSGMITEYEKVRNKLDPFDDKYKEYGPTMFFDQLSPKRHKEILADANKAGAIGGVVGQFMHNVANAKNTFQDVSSGIKDSAIVSRMKKDVPDGHKPIATTEEFDALNESSDLDSGKPTEIKEISDAVAEQEKTKGSPTAQEAKAEAEAVSFSDSDQGRVPSKGKQIKEKDTVSNPDLGPDTVTTEEVSRADNTPAKAYDGEEHTGSVETDNKSVRIELPELVKMVKELTGNVPAVRRVIDKLKNVRGKFSVNDRGFMRMQVQKDLAKDPDQMVRTLAHEMGHLDDYFPDKAVKKGGILANISGIKKMFKHNLNIGDGKSINRDVIKKELIKLSEWWRPYDKAESTKGHIKYRESASEIYGDAVSVWLNNPRALASKAPEFSKAMSYWRKQHPEFTKVYDKIQEQITSGNLTEIRTKDREDAIRRVNDKRNTNMKTSVKDNLKSLRDGIKWLLVDKFAPVLDTLKTKKFGPIKTFEGKNREAMIAITELPYSSSMVENFVVDIDLHVIGPMRQAGFEDSDIVIFEDYLHNMRALHGDISDKANTIYGKNEALKNIEYARKRLGDEKFQVMKKASEEFVESRQENIVRTLKETGVFDPEFIKFAEKNIWYVARGVEKYIGKGVLGNDGSGKPTAASTSFISSMVGSFEDVGGGFSETILKDYKGIVFAKRNQAYAKIADAWIDTGVGKRGDVDQDTGDTQVLYDQKREAPLYYMRNGQVEVVIGPKVAVDALNHKGVPVLDTISNITSWVSSPLKQVYTTLNPAFMLKNPVRDIQRNLINLEGATLKDLPKYYIDSIEDAISRLKGEPSDIIREMNRGGMLINVAERKGVETENIAAIRQLKVRTKEGASAKKKLLRVLEVAGKLGDMGESLHKIAAYKYLKENQVKLGISDAEIGFRVRRFAGSSDYLVRQGIHGLTSNIYMFFNPMVQGIRSDYQAFVENPQEVALKRLVYGATPKALMVMATMGLFGDDIEKQYEQVSSWDLMNSYVIPVWNNEDGIVFFKAPADETTRYFNGILWGFSMWAAKVLSDNEDDYYKFKGKQGDFNIVGYSMDSATPSWNPVIEMFLSGKKTFFENDIPVDSFTGREAWSQEMQDQEATDLAVTFAKYWYNKTLGAIGPKVQVDRYQEVELKSEFSKIIKKQRGNWGINAFFGLATPGDDDAYFAQKEDKRVEKSRSRLKAKDFTFNLLEGKEVSVDEVIAAINNQKSVRGWIKSAILRKHGHEWWAKLERAKKDGDWAVIETIRQMQRLKRENKND